MKNKKSQTILISVLILLLILAAIIIVWQIINPPPVQTEQPYYLSITTFCEHYNMTDYETYYGFANTPNYFCILNINDTAIERPVDKLNERFYFREETVARIVSNETVIKNIVLNNKPSEDGTITIAAGITMINTTGCYHNEVECNCNNCISINSSGAIVVNK